MIKKSFIFKNFLKKNSKGVTLIELLVVFFIILLLSAIVLLNYDEMSSKFALERSAYKLAQAIRKAEEMAMSAKECPCGTSGELIVPPGGYGIYFDLETSDKGYRLYADTQPPNKGNEFYTPSDDNGLEDISLEGGVIIKQIKIKGGMFTIDSKKAGINFKPPSPTVKIKHGNENDNDDMVEIKLCVNNGCLPTDPDTKKIKTITVNKAGRVEVE